MLKFAEKNRRLIMETIKPEPNDLLDRDIKLEIEKMIESSKKIIDICDRISQEFFELESNEAVLKKRKFWRNCRINGLDVKDF